MRFNVIWLITLLLMVTVPAFGLVRELLAFAEETNNDFHLITIAKQLQQYFPNDGRHIETKNDALAAIAYYKSALRHR